eukprot:1200918-Pyramimonas_sp.AAC.1
MHWALVLEQDRGPPVRQPVFYAIRWLYLKFNMYVCLHSDSTGVAALQQAHAVKRLICDPPSFLQPGLDRHSEGIPLFALLWSSHLIRICAAPARCCSICCRGYCPAGGIS